ncbi:MAG TPA: ECF-type sigma factor [Pirellulaceae bacterium]|nr:ECF-type sigma factor [Pirellulaceae bacterium]
MPAVTQLLDAAAAGDPAAAAQLLPLVYNELRTLAAARMAAERSDHTLSATALVHEAYLRLVARPGGEAGGEVLAWNSRGHFFAAAAEAMRRILVESARRKGRLRHGGGRRRLDLEQVAVLHDDQNDELLALDEALGRLDAEEPETAAVVKLRYFAGLTTEQAAAALDISLRTANRHWAYARAWLFQALGGDSEEKSV